MLCCVFRSVTTRVVRLIHRKYIVLSNCMWSNIDIHTENKYNGFQTNELFFKFIYIIVYNIQRSLFLITNKFKLKAQTHCYKVIAKKNFYLYFVFLPLCISINVFLLFIIFDRYKKSQRCFWPGLSLWLLLFVK